MSDSKEKTWTAYELVRELLGPINPVADSAVDRERLENLKATTELSEALLRDIDEVSMCGEGRHEASVKEASKCASDYFDQLGIPRE